MEARDQIILEIKNLVIKFPTLKVRYENDLLSNAHFLEVSANENFNFQSKDYLGFIEDVTFRFIGMFPLQNISFISEDSLVGLDKVDFELNGSLFGSLANAESSYYRKIEVNHDRINRVEMSDFVKNLAHFSGILNPNEQNITVNLVDVRQPFFNPKTIVLQNGKLGETNYAMAA